MVKKISNKIWPAVCPCAWVIITADVSVTSIVWAS